MLAVLAEFERGQVAERTRSALSHLRNQGKRISGTIPYGHDLSSDGETLVPNLAEQEGLRFILALQAEGKGRRKIAMALMVAGIPTKTGAPWSPQAVGSTIRRDRLCRPKAPHFAA